MTEYFMNFRGNSLIYSAIEYYINRFGFGNYLMIIVGGLAVIYSYILILSYKRQAYDNLFMQFILGVIVFVGLIGFGIEMV